MWNVLPPLFGEKNEMMTNAGKKIPSVVGVCVSLRMSPSSECRIEIYEQWNESDCHINNENDARRAIQTRCDYETLCLEAFATFDAQNCLSFLVSCVLRRDCLASYIQWNEKWNDSQRCFSSFVCDNPHAYALAGCFCLKFLHVAFFGIRMCKQLNLIMIFINVHLNSFCCCCGTQQAQHLPLSSTA